MRQFAFRPKHRRGSPLRAKKQVDVHREEKLRTAENLKNTLSNVKAQMEATTEAHGSIDHVQTEKEISPFRYDSTYTLLKKFLIYKIMSSNFCINYSLVGMNFSYRLFGVRLTNTVIERTAGSIFTGGVTLDDLNKDIKALEERNIGGIGCYVVEGVREPEDSQLDKFTEFTMESIKGLTEHATDGHFALKLTAFIGTCALERVSLA